MQNRTVTDASGESLRLSDNIAQDDALRLYQTVLSLEAQTVVEIGMAYGIATLAICSALAQLNKGGKCLSIDPFQNTDWRGIGVLNVEKAGFAGYHELIEQPDYFALPTLLSRGVKYDLAYIDGWHTFDYVMIDLFYVDKSLNPGGVVVFNDCQMPSVQRAIGFLKSHRKYNEFPVSVRGNKRFLSEMKKRTIQLILQNEPDRYFRKEENWEPAWDFYKDF